MCAEVSEWSIRQVISHFWEQGTIEGGRSVQEECKQNWHLWDVDVEVSVLTLLVWNIEFLSGSYLGLSINNWICTLMNSRKCLKLVVVPVFHNLPSDKHSDRLDSQWRRWADKFICFIFIVKTWFAVMPLAHLCCSWVICRKASWLYCEDWHIHSGATYLCWWVLCWSLNYIQRLCMVYLWN